MRNNTVVAIITHRTSTLDTLPDALNQSEIGFASDASRLFIGNPENPELQARTAFPYQNVEILTEFSNLGDYVKYSYVNNIKTANGKTDRGNLIEQIPILVQCSAYTSPEADKTLSLNGMSVTIGANAEISAAVSAINAVSGESKVTASSIDGLSLYLFCTAPALEIGGDSDVLALLGVPAEHDTLSSLLPQRRLSEKLDDTLHITDYGIAPDTDEDLSKAIASALVGIYGRYPDNQFKREVFFPAGTYLLKGGNAGNDFSIPLLSGTDIRGEGIDRTIIQSDDNLWDNYIFQTMDNDHNYALSENYKSDEVAVDGIILRDMTIICNAGKGVMLLRNAKNIVFENVRIVGSSSGDTIKVYGDSEQVKTTGIVFDGCQFERGNKTLVFEQNVENVLVSNTAFKEANEYFVEIGAEDIADCKIRGVSFNNNIFTKSNSTTVLNRVLGGTEYVTFTNSTFDKDNSEYTNSAAHPFNEDFNASGKNYTDTLDPTTDARKVLQFRFRQPEWVFLSKLYTDKGVLGISVRENEEELPTSDKQFLDVVVKSESSLTGEVKDSIDINVVGTVNGTDLVVKNETGTIIADASNDIELKADGEIIAGADIDLNDKKINNKLGNGDLTLNTTDDKIVVIEDTDGTKSYPERANGVGNAVVTVDMLKAFKETFVYDITKGTATIEDGMVLVDDLSKKYRDGLKLKSIELNFKGRNHLLSQYKTTDAATYKNGCIYYAGDVIRSTGENPLYYVALKDFEAGYETIAEEIAGTGSLVLVGEGSSAKYADIIVESSADQSVFMLGAVYDLGRQTHLTVDCSMVDTFNTPVKKYEAFKEGLTAGDIVEYQDNLYKAVNPVVDNVTSWENNVGVLDLSEAVSVSKLELNITNSSQTSIVFGGEDADGEPVYYKISDGALVELTDEQASDADAILTNGNTVEEISAMASLPLDGENLSVVMAVKMTDKTAQCIAGFTCEYKYLVEEVETDGTITVSDVVVFDPADIADTAEARILWLHNSGKFERLDSSVGYNYEITGANGVKKIDDKTVVNGGSLVDISAIDLGKSKVYVRFFDELGNVVEVGDGTMPLFDGFDMSVTLGVYE